MMFFILALFLGIPVVVASATICTAYASETVVIIPPVYTDYAYVTSPTTTISIWFPTRTREVDTTISSTPTTTITVGSKTLTKDGGTVTVGATKTLTKTCPRSTCSAYTTRTTTLTETNNAAGSSTTTSTITQDFILTYPNTSVTTLTTTTGDPPVTATIESTITQVTQFVTITFANEVEISATATKTKGTQTTTYTKTKTVKPTATATITLFSLQVYNTSLAFDGYLVHDFGQFARIDTPEYCATTEDHAYCQDLFYVDPKSHYLYESTTKNYAVYDNSGGAYSEKDFIFIDDGPITGPGDRRHFTCKAECGKLLTCAIKGKDKALFLYPAADIRYTPVVAFDDEATDPVLNVNLQVVGPTLPRA